MKGRHILLVVLLVVMVGSGVVRAKPVAAESSLQVTASIGLNLRTGPGMEYSIITVMPWGTIVTGYEWSGEWVHVAYAGLYGWSHGAWLADASATPNTTTSTPSTVSGEGTGTGGYNACVDNTWGQVVCAPDWIAEAIFTAAAQYGADAWFMLHVAACESNFDPGTVGTSGEIGIFQFMPDTFYSYGSGDIYSVWDQSYTAASMFAQGLSYHWVCAGR